MRVGEHVRIIQHDWTSNLESMRQARDAGMGHSLRTPPQRPTRLAKPIRRPARNVAGSHLSKVDRDELLQFNVTTTGMPR